MYGIPKNPVDRFTYTWWEIFGDKVFKNTATFYVDAPFREVLPDYHCEGPAFRNEWLYELGCGQGGRGEGWGHLRRSLFGKERDPWNRVYLTEKEAFEALLKNLQDRRQKLLEDIGNLRNLIEDNEAKLEQL